MKIITSEITLRADDATEAAKILKLLDTRTKAERVIPAVENPELGGSRAASFPAAFEPPLAERWRTQIPQSDGSITMSLSGPEIAEFAEAVAPKYKKLAGLLRELEPVGAEAEAPVPWSEALVPSDA